MPFDRQLESTLMAQNIIINNDIRWKWKVELDCLKRAPSKLPIPNKLKDILIPKT